MISQAISYAAGCGFQMRGIYGRDREVFGDLYQVSNQTTLGISEAEIAEKLKSTADNIAESELAARRTLREQDPLGLQDKVSRSLGVLKHARLMEMEEALRHLSNVMVGLEDKTLTGAAPEDIYLVAEEILPVMLEGSVRQRNSQRSDILRKRLDNVTENDKT